VRSRFWPFLYLVAIFVMAWFLFPNGLGPDD
jgi:uncharacterized RDD family membrane protein YckC